MGIIGVGHKILGVVVPYLIAAVWLSVFKPETYRIFSGQNYLLVPGLVILSAGLIVNAVSAIRVVKAYKDKKLLTDGTFAFSRHPVYSSFVLLTAPGFGLAFNSWAVLLASPIALFMFLYTVKEEETHLEKQFGEPYWEYRNKTGKLFTIGKFKF